MNGIDELVEKVQVGLHPKGQTADEWIDVQANALSALARLSARTKGAEAAFLVAERFAREEREQGAAAEAQAARNLRALEQTQHWLNEANARADANADIAEVAEARVRELTRLVAHYERRLGYPDFAATKEPA